MQLGIVLVGDQDLGDVALGDRRSDHALVDQRLGRLWNRGHVGLRPYSVAAVKADQIAYSIRRSDRARRVRVTVDVTAASRSCCPRRAPEREAAAAIRELRPWIERRLHELERDARGGRGPR